MGRLRSHWNDHHPLGPLHLILGDVSQRKLILQPRASSLSHSKPKSSSISLAVERVEEVAGHAGHIGIW